MRCKLSSPPRWHLSLTFLKRGWHRHRPPTWVETIEARLQLLPANCVICVNLDDVDLDTTLHLIEHSH